ncbi:MAG: DNA polymerase III subunit gamma/tau [Actinobacteria bacterium]|nr:DNA polymerase III subunit gamma/tau [Actinomycetota bacterium]
MEVKGLIMSGISLYRKWRPQKFEDVVGQKRVTETLANALSSGRLVHAYLFTGPRGTGKTSTARILAKAINCEKGPTATPCNVCEACVSISEGKALDVEEIDAASNRKIDEIRGLLEKIPYLPASMRSKVYIIDEVHQLTSEASSALLKTLEEPPGHIVFVLATTEPHKLLPTIVSRCQRFDFSLVDTEVISELLRSIAESENIDISADAVSMIAEQSQGSVRDAIGVIDQIANITDEKISTRQVAELLGDVEPEMVFEMIDIIADRDTPEALLMVARMMESGKDPRRFAEALISQLRNLFLIQNAKGADEIVRVTADHFKRLGQQAEKIRKPDILKLIERLGDVHREMRWSENPRLDLECALVKSLRMETDISIEGLVYRIEELEEKLKSSKGKDSREPGTEGGDSGARPASGKKDPAIEPGELGRAAGRQGALKSAKGKGPASAKKDDKDGSPASGAREARKETIEAVVGAGEDTDAFDRNKAKRAWMAVLSDMKNRGEMSLYALLTKAKIQDFRDGRLSISFPEEAAFQAAAFEKDDNISKVEGAWRALVGEKVSINVVSRESFRPRKKEASPFEMRREQTDVDIERNDRNPVSTGEEEQGAKEKEPDGGDPGAIARLLKESFDGEIIELSEEGTE